MADPKEPGAKSGVGQIPTTLSAEQAAEQARQIERNRLMQRQMEAYLELLGFGRFDQKDPNQKSAALGRAYEGFLEQYGEGKRMFMAEAVDLMRQMVKSDPEVADRMKQIVSARDPKAVSEHDASVLQHGLAARGRPVEVGSPLRMADIRAVGAMRGTGPDVAPANPATQFARAVRFDPQVEEAQAYLRILGYNGKDGKPDVGAIDGNRGASENSKTLTNAALAQFAKDNKLPAGVPMADIIRVLKEKAVSGPGLARMEDMMGKSVLGVQNDDVKAVQVVLRTLLPGSGIAATGKPDAAGNDVAALRVARLEVDRASQITFGGTPEPRQATAPAAYGDFGETTPAEVAPATLAAADTARSIGSRNKELSAADGGSFTVASRPAGVDEESVPRPEDNGSPAVRVATSKPASGGPV